MRQGPWKIIFKKEGTRELYNLDTDLSETKDVLATNSEVAAKLTTLMRRHINEGRSTPGEAQKNDFALSIDESNKGKKGKKTKKGKSADAGGKSEAERAREMALAADPSFD